MGPGPRTPAAAPEEDERMPEPEPEPEATPDAPTMSARRRQLAEEGLSDDDCDRVVLKRSVPVLREEAELRARVHGHIARMLQGGWARASSGHVRMRRLM